WCACAAVLPIRMECDENHAPPFSVFGSGSVMIMAAGIVCTAVIGARLPTSGEMRSRLAPDARPPALDCHRHAAIPSADDGEVFGQHDQPERDHPKAEDWQESKHSAENEQHAEPDPKCAALCQSDPLFAETQFGHAR